MIWVSRPGAVGTPFKSCLYLILEMRLFFVGSQGWHTEVLKKHLLNCYLLADVCTVCKCPTLIHDIKYYFLPNWPFIFYTFWGLLVVDIMSVFLPWFCFYNWHTSALNEKRTHPRGQALVQFKQNEWRWGTLRSAQLSGKSCALLILTAWWILDFLAPSFRIETGTCFQ